MSSQSPDINPIENLWHILDLQIREGRISNKDGLEITILFEEWTNISRDATKSILTRGVNPKMATIQAKEMHTNRNTNNI